jgi:hypothetical protein
MESKREQALVGVFVLISAAVVIGTIFAISGTLAEPQEPTMPTSPSPDGSSLA